VKQCSDSIEARFTARHQKSIDLCGDVRDKKILNIGCYNGWFEQVMIKKRAREVIGIDTNKKFVKIAQKHVPQVKFLKMSALNLNFPQNYFDLITIFDVIEHLPKNTEARCLQEIDKVLKSKGRLIVSTPNNHFLAKIFDPAWYLGHRHYSEQQLTNLLKKEGFSVTKTEQKGGFYEITSMLLLYFFKWVLRLEIPFKDWFEKKREEEYLGKRKGYVTIFLRGRKH